MKIIRASHLGMCFGVRDAIAIAAREARQQPVTVLGQLVHNPVVVGDLRQRGVQVADTAEAVHTSTVLISAHGASDKARGALAQQGLRVVETTCPLVHHAHQALQRLIDQGCHPVVIGKRGHVEVRGLTEDLPVCDIVLSEADIAAMEERPRFGVVAQTTQPVDRVDALVNALRRRFPRAEVRFADTVCRPTKQRQAAAIRLARACDVVVVVGGTNSNNTRELAETCRRHCARVHRVEAADEVQAAWFRHDDIVGITAGTSTPDVTITAVERRLDQLGAGWERVAPEPTPAWEAGSSREEELVTAGRH